jgi:uncharacterized membrane protein
MYAIGVRIGGRAMGLLAALILALSPFHVQYAQDVRMYAMLTFMASVALLCAVSLLDDDQNEEPRIENRVENDGSRFLALGSQSRWWLGLIVFTTLTILSHNTALFFPLALGLFVAVAFGAPALLRRARGAQDPARDRRLWRWIVALGAVLLLWLPWLPGFLVQVRRVDAEFWIPAPTRMTVLETWRDFASAHAPGGQFLTPILLAFGAVALLGMWRLRRKPALLTLLLLLIVVPFAGELLVSLRRPIFYTRTLIWASIPFYLLLAAGLLQLRWRALIAAATLALVLLNGASLNGYYRYYEPEGWRDAAGWLAPQVRDGDILLFNAGWVQIPFDYYYQRVGPPIEQRGLPADLFDRGILEPKMTTADLPRLDQLIAGRRRVWLIYSHDWYTDPQRIIPRALAARLRQKDARAFNGLKIFAYEQR